jgi:hypothetical protein
MMQGPHPKKVHHHGGSTGAYIREPPLLRSTNVHRVMAGELTERQVQAAQSVILTHGRELCSPEDFARNRWQSIMAKERLGNSVSQQLLSKFIKTGRIRIETLRVILRKLGEDPDEVLGTGSAPSGPDPNDMSPARAKVIWRNRQWYPEEVVDEVLTMPLDATRLAWTEADWIHELDEARGRWLRAKALGNRPKVTR